MDIADRILKGMGDFVEKFDKFPKKIILRRDTMFKMLKSSSPYFYDEMKSKMFTGGERGLESCRWFGCKIKVQKINDPNPLKQPFKVE